MLARSPHRLSGHLDELTIPMPYLYGRQDFLGPVENTYLYEDRVPNVQFLSAGRLTKETADWAGISQRRAELYGIVT